MKEILIYHDEGACIQSVQSLRFALEQEGLFTQYKLHLADRKTLKSPDWLKKTALLIMPGGRDRPYQQALQGEANENIRLFVEKGGRYLGICAGAYYSCRSFEFEKGHPLEIIEQRELAFFPGLAEGPAYGPGQFSYDHEQGARTARLSLYQENENPIASAAYYNGGCTFRGTEKEPEVKVIARYADIEGFPPAIILCPIGKGLALLSGVHPEHPLKGLAEKKRRLLFQELLSRLKL